MAQKPKKPPLSAQAGAIAALPPPVASAPPGIPAPESPAFFAFSYSYAELAAFGRDNLDAAAKANAALTQGLESIGQELMACARAALMSATETARGLLGAKTLEDVVKLQTEFAKRNLDGLMSGTVKLSEIGCMVASEAMAPLGGRVGAVIAQFAPVEAKPAA